MLHNRDNIVTAELVVFDLRAALEQSTVIILTINTRTDQTGHEYSRMFSRSLVLMLGKWQREQPGVLPPTLANTHTQPQTHASESIYARASTVAQFGLSNNSEQFTKH